MKINRKDWLLLSTYFDGELTGRQKARLEKRLQIDPQLQRAFQQMKATRAILSSTPVLESPKDFSLTPEMVGKSKADQKERLFPGFQFAAAVFAVALAVVLLVDYGGLRGGNAALEAAAPLMQEKAVEEAVELETSPETAAPGELEGQGEEVFSLEAEESRQEGEEPDQAGAPEGDLIPEEPAENAADAVSEAEEPQEEAPQPMPTPILEPSPTPSPLPSPEPTRLAPPTPVQPIDGRISEASRGLSTPLFWIELFLGIGVVGFSAAAWLRRKNRR